MYHSAEIRTDRSLWDWPRRAEAWLDARGKWAWIAAMVTGFIIFTPLGLAILAWMIWGKKMFGKSCRTAAKNAAKSFDFSRLNLRPTGNSAFDNYREETLKRLEQEQEAFETFLTRLRDARDKQEFDRFMDERTKSDAALPADLIEASRKDEAPRRGEA